MVNTHLMVSVFFDVVFSYKIKFYKRTGKAFLLIYILLEIHPFLCSAMETNEFWSPLEPQNYRYETADKIEKSDEKLNDYVSKGENILVQAKKYLDKITAFAKQAQIFIANQKMEFNVDIISSILELHPPVNTIIDLESAVKTICELVIFSEWEFPLNYPPFIGSIFILASIQKSIHTFFMTEQSESDTKNLLENLIEPLKRIEDKYGQEQASIFLDWCKEYETLNTQSEKAEPKIIPLTSGNPEDDDFVRTSMSDS